VQTGSAPYSCDFSGYGSGSGFAAVTITAGYQVNGSWPVSNPDDIFLVVPSTGSLSLPSGVSSQLTGVDSFEVQATVQTAQNSTTTTVTVAGDSIGTTLPNPPTQVPQIISEGQVTFAAQGTGTVALPPATFVITPFAGTTAKKAITCTTTSAAANVTITVGAAAGPFYQCTATAGGATATESTLLDMTVAASGGQTVGATDTVTLSSTDLWSFILTGLRSGLTAEFSGSLPVQGAQSGSVALTSTTTTPPAGAFTATGTLSLSNAGTIDVLLPQTFTVTVTAQGSQLPVTCTLQTSPAPTALALSVTSGSGGSTTGSGTPAGAPATGGGLGLASGTTPVATGAGAALMAVGGVLLWAAGRRRARTLPGGGLWRGRRRRSS
jgi:hypothetical protein